MSPVQSTLLNLFLIVWALFSTIGFMRKHLANNRLEKKILIRFIRSVHVLIRHAAHDRLNPDMIEAIAECEQLDDDPFNKELPWFKDIKRSKLASYDCNALQYLANILKIRKIALKDGNQELLRKYITIIRATGGTVPHPDQLFNKIREGKAHSAFTKALQV